MNFKLVVALSFVLGSAPLYAKDVSRQPVTKALNPAVYRDLIRVKPLSGCPHVGDPTVSSKARVTVDLSDSQFYSMDVYSDALLSSSSAADEKNAGAEIQVGTGDQISTISFTLKAFTGVVTGAPVMIYRMHNGSGWSAPTTVSMTQDILGYKASLDAATIQGFFNADPHQTGEKEPKLAVELCAKTDAGIADQKFMINMYEGWAGNLSVGKNTVQYSVPSERTFPAP